ncbi:hypothetical protein D0T84_14420 [Dysgonomonas sp. 521]|uniref:hypothetical protein n=1 Tax=Dysgonomonas sp. 521 TaxID=2302932 RepID=UPI0013CFCF67|nr:hypothetical protein [Dysgonomonas sp. 521]NDV96097.1 hypothetical protein [Dysgonomonas sp. 521]
MDNNNQLSRVPQNFSFDKDALLRTFGEESAIIRDIIVYAANCQFLDLWGNITFSIEDFCREFGYSRTTLQRTLPEFKETKKNLPVIDDHVFDSLFEYALYRALKENVIFKRKKDNKETFESVQLISHLDVIYDKSTKKLSKRLYSVKLGHKIIENLFKEYHLIDFYDYKRLKSSKISSVGAFRNFYIFMARIIAQVRFYERSNNPQNFITSIDDLCDVFGVSVDTPKNKKAYITKTLKHIQESLVNTKFDWSFVTNGTKHSYFVEFIFSKETLAYFDEKLKAVFFKKLHSAAEQIYIKEKGGLISHSSVLDAYRNIDREDFYKWFMSDDSRDKKMKIWNDLYSETFGVVE